MGYIMKRVSNTVLKAPDAFSDVLDGFGKGFGKIRNKVRASDHTCIFRRCSCWWLCMWLHDMFVVVALLCGIYQVKLVRDSSTSLCSACHSHSVFPLYLFYSWVWHRVWHEISWTALKSAPLSTRRYESLVRLFRVHRPCAGPHVS